MNIVFFGTPYFAAYHLEQLIECAYNIVAVVTTPDTQQGRGRKIHPSPVKKIALSHNLTVLQPDKMQDKTFIKNLRSLKPNLFIIVAFRKLPEYIWKIAGKGTINLHTSLLPAYRGAAPINRVIMNGETHTGVSTFYINDKIDTGDILLQKKILLSNQITAGELHNKLMESGALLLLKTLNELNNISPVKQGISQSLKIAYKIQKQDLRINWNSPIENIYNLIRGLSPLINKEKYLEDVAICPSAWCIYNNGHTERRLKINNSEIIKESSGNKFLSLYTDNKEYLHINLKEGRLAIINVQLEGKKAMNIKQFLAGNKINTLCSIS
ncbi:MAG: methionyl-tRNA formyltransferase [Bacteroidota bacterium]|nr:methionyl-tRNA formyltransferase [Bacteroidota bacterium]